jgi:glycosyltransferase involved in cell wall biosynthesis
MQLFDTPTFLKTYNLFWQYPVITEQEFYNQNKKNPNYCGLPWATFIDKRIDTNSLIKVLLPYMKHKHYYTCCQHIFFRKMIPLMRVLGITTLYTPHKIIGEDSINGVTIKPCPLYAVNIEDPQRNSLFKKYSDDYTKHERPYLYSFVGGYQPSNYLSDIRKRIFTMEKPPNAVIVNTGGWHFNNTVYSTKQNANGELNEDSNTQQRTEHYNDTLLKSRYSLCPSGSGPNSIRFWESLAVGSIPVVLADTLELPSNPLWGDAIVRIKEADLESLHTILIGIDELKEKIMRKNCIELYNYYKNNYKDCNKTIIHYCCGSYDIGDFGGVARYDYHIQTIYPHRIFVKGPQQKDLLLKILENVDNPIVITDNHLACDIPNKYMTILVHHGSAVTHAEREPDWHPYWKKLCCDGQKKMLTHRDPNKTLIVSTSKFCFDEFSRFFPVIYPRFKNELVLHTSELDETNYKTVFNETPIVFGNFKGWLKGEHIYEKLKALTTPYIFEKLQINYNKQLHKNYTNYNKEKQKYYMERDIFLQLSLCEGFSYATLDAFACGNVVVATDVGLTYSDVPDDCYVKLDYRRVNELDYIIERLDFAWKNRELLSKNARSFYRINCNFEQWKTTMYNVVNTSFTCLEI